MVSLERRPIPAAIQCLQDSDCLEGTCSSGTCHCTADWQYVQGIGCAKRLCDDTETPFSDVSCYKTISTIQTTQPEAQRLCIDAGYHLPAIASTGELHFLTTLGLARVWTDGTRLGGVWKWSTDEPFKITGFDTDNGESCLYVRANDSKWHIWRCSFSRKFVCERSIWKVCTVDSYCVNGACNSYGVCVCLTGWGKDADQKCTENLVPTTVEVITSPPVTTLPLTTTVTTSPTTVTTSTTTVTTSPATVTTSLTTVTTSLTTVTTLDETSPSTKSTTPSGLETSTHSTTEFTSQFAPTAELDTTTAESEHELSTKTDVSTTYAQSTTVDYCGTNRCQNEATCAVMAGGYQCQCLFGYEGTHCEVVLYPDADYSSLRPVTPTDLFKAPPDDARINPFYLLAAYYSSMQSRTFNPTPPSTDIVTGRGSIGRYLRLSSPRAWIDPVYFSSGGTCVEGGIDDCDRGFAMSMWVFLEKKPVYSGESIVFYAGTDVTDLDTPHVVILIDADLNLKFQVNSGSLLWNVTVQTDIIPWGLWCNLAMTWKPNTSLMAYINGWSVGTLHVIPLDTMNVTSSPAASPWEITIGGRGLRTSLSPMTVSDLVLWDRFLFEFERHRYLGMTAEELHVLQRANYLWSTDGYLRRDHTSIDGQPIVANAGDILIPTGSPLVVVPGRDGKGRAVEVDGAANRWFALGDKFTGKCISDPSLCPDGITIALWVQLRRPISDNQTSFAFIFSSGGQSSRGCAIYVVGSDRLRATVADGSREWIVELDFNPNEDDWVHIAMAWGPSSGMVLYINGDTRAIDQLGVIRLREADLDPRLLLGRRNDYLAGFAQFSLEQLAIWKRAIEPWQARREFGLIENSQYSSASYYWNVRQLVSSTFTYLSDAAVDGVILGPNVNVKVYNSLAVDLTNPGASLLLGDFSGTCVSNPSLCGDGLSVSFWLKFVHQETAENMSQIISSGAHTENYGFAVFIKGSSVVFVIDCSIGRWTASIKKELLVNNKWTNLALTWSIGDTITIYVNGIEPDVDYQLTGGSTTDDSKLLIVGDTSTSHLAAFYIYNLAIWESYVPHQMIHQLIGMSKYEFHCLSSGDVCWSFEYPRRIRPRYQLSTSGVSITRDRHHKERGVCSDGVSGGISLLGVSASQCPNDPSACVNGFVMGMWVKLKRVTSSRNSGYLLSVGATDPGERGVSLFQSITGIRVKVVEASIMWRTDIKSSWLTYDQWMYLGIVWSGHEQHLKVVIDGEEMLTLLSHMRGAYRAHDVSSISLGKSSQSNSGFLAACYDDVIILRPKDGDHHPSTDTLTGEPDFERYLSAEEHFDVNDPEGPVIGEDYAATEDRFGVENSSVDTGVPGSPLGYINLGDFAGQCVSDPSLCDAGLSISVWLKVDNMDHFADPIVNPGGVGYILSSGAQSSNGTGLSALYSRDKFLYVQVLDGHRKWFSKLDFELGRDWLNFGMSWSKDKGLLVIVDGRVKGSDPVGEPLTRTMDQFTTLILGKRNDRNTSYLGGAFDDPAIWYHAFDEDDPNLADTITGKDIDDVVETVKYEDLDESSPEIAKPTCKIIHEADCAKTIQQLLDVIKGEIILSEDAAESSTNSLMRFTAGSSSLSSSELDAAVSVIGKLSKRQLATTMDDVTAEANLMDFLEVTSNLLEPVFTKKWIALQQTKAGVTSLMESVETFAADVADRLEWNTQVLLNTSRILMTMDVLSEDYFISGDEAIFPGHSQRWETLYDKWRNVDEHVTIPKEIFNSEIKKNFSFDGSLVFTLYDSLNKMVPVVSTNKFVLIGGKSLRVNSNIMSVMTEPKIQHTLKKPIMVTLNHHTPVTKSKHETPVCAFWNFDVLHTINGAWDREGCEVQSTSQTQTHCLCYHMTHFAIVMEPLQEPVYDDHAVVLRWLVRCLVGVSVFCLVVLIVTYVASKRLHTLRHSVHLNLCLACLLASVSFALSEFTANSQVLCLVNGAAMQFFYLAVILWLTMESFQLYSDTSVEGIDANDAMKGFAVWRNRMGFYIIGGWVTPAVVVGSVLGVSQHVYKPQSYDLCWIVEENGMLWSFCAPCCLAFCVILVVLIMVIKATDSTIRDHDVKTGFRSSVRATCILSLLFAATWMMGWKAIYGGPLWTYYTFVILNSLLMLVEFCQATSRQKHRPLLVDTPSRNCGMVQRMNDIKPGFFVFILQGLGNTEVRALLCHDDPDLELALVKEIPIPVHRVSIVQVHKPLYVA